MNKTKGLKSNVENWHGKARIFVWEGWVLVSSDAASEVWEARKCYFLERLW